MPFYEYQCQACGQKTEELQKVNDPPLLQCPACGKKKLERFISLTGFQLTGTGWYETDFKDKKPQPVEQTETDNAASAPAEKTTDNKVTEKTVEKPKEKKAEPKTAEKKSSETGSA
jgi:putative FmdB family regulatory protein